MTPCLNLLTAISKHESDDDQGQAGQPHHYSGYAQAGNLVGKILFQATDPVVMDRVDKAVILQRVFGKVEEVPRAVVIGGTKVAQSSF